MADKFRVGQRVIIVKSNMNHPHLVGKVVTIIDIKHPDIHTIDEINPANGDNFWAFGDQIEPVYDGDEQSSWHECLWKPNLLFILSRMK